MGNKELTIDWSKFKIRTKISSNVTQAKNGFIEFCEMLDKLDFELIGDYVGSKEKVELAYKYDNSIKLIMCPNSFKRQTYKHVINFKNNLIKNNDKFIKFIGLSGKSSLIAQIKTFDSGVVKLEIGSYGKFNNGRLDTYNYCKKKGYKILSPYLGDGEKILVDFNCGHDYHCIRPFNLKQNQGCPNCSESRGEKAIRLYLKNNNIEFIQECKFDDCKYKKGLPFDFYIPNYNLCIEFDGRQHFESEDFFGGEESFKLTQKRDKIKNKFCEDNGISLLRIPYYELENVEEILDKEFERLRKLDNKLKIVI